MSEDAGPDKTLASEAELEGALQELASNAKAAGRPILVGLEARTATLFGFGELVG